MLVNMLGNIDVEIKVDEGPDTETVMGDVFDLLMALSQNNVPVPPEMRSSRPRRCRCRRRRSCRPWWRKTRRRSRWPSSSRCEGQAGRHRQEDAEAQKLTAEAGKAQTGGMLNIAKAQTEGMPDGRRAEVAARRRRAARHHQREERHRHAQAGDLEPASTTRH
jgi:hypothetical protein